MGAREERHTSLLIDLNNRAYFFTFLDVNITNGHVIGSSNAHISLYGDTGGAALPFVPVSPTKSLNLPSVSKKNKN